MLQKKTYCFKTVLKECVKLSTADNLPVIAVTSENVMNVNTGPAVTYSKCNCSMIIVFDSYSNAKQSFCTHKVAQ